MQAEGQLDNERNAVLGEALLQLVLERLDVAARCQEPGLEMLASDDAEMLGRYRVAVLLHRRQQFLDARVVDALDAKELRQRLMRAAGLGQDVALHGGAGKSPELGDKFPHRALTLKLAVPGNVRSDVTLQPALVVPMRAGGVARTPLLPNRIGGLDVDELLAVPEPAQCQVRIEPHIRLHQQLEAALCERQPILTPPAGFGPLHRDGGPARAGAWRHRMGELGLAVDMIDAELDAMQLPARLDDGDADGLGIDLPVVVVLAVKDVGHRQNGLQRIALRASRRRNISFAAGDPVRFLASSIWSPPAGFPHFFPLSHSKRGINLAHDKKHVIERSWPEAGVSAALAVILIESSPALVGSCRSPRPIRLPLSRSYRLHLSHSTAEATNSREPFPRRLRRNAGWLEAGVLHRQSGIGASLGRPVRVANTRGLAS